MTTWETKQEPNNCVTMTTRETKQMITMTTLKTKQDVGNQTNDNHDDARRTQL